MLATGAASRVGHPNAISVLDLGRDAQGEVFLVQELHEGETLAQRLARCGPRPFAEVCALLLPEMDALCEAHRQGVVHRDLKPDNVFRADPEGHRRQRHGGRPARGHRPGDHVPPAAPPRARARERVRPSGAAPAAPPKTTAP